MNTMPKKIKFIAPLILIAQFVFLCSCGTASLSDKVWADGSLRKLHEKYGFVYAFATDTLSTLRSQIDEIDSQLVDLVAKRMRISCEIGQYKKIHGMGIVQSNRFNEILEKRCAQGASQGIDPACVKSIFEAIHQESVNQQKEIQTAK